MASLRFHAMNSSPSISNAGEHQEVRCAGRFPLKLAVLITSNGEDFAATTLNVSASGVLFAMDRSIAAGTSVQFSLRMPGEVLGMKRDVLVQCSGRVIRCTMNQSTFHTAATIDDYQFVEQ